MLMNICGYKNVIGLQKTKAAAATAPTLAPTQIISLQSFMTRR